MFVLLPRAAEPAAPALIALAAAVATIVSLVLVLPARAGVVDRLASSAAAAVLLGLSLLAAPATRELAAHLPEFLAVFLMLSATCLLLAALLPAAIAALLLLLLVAAPLWAAPLLELAGNPAGLNALVLRASPLTSLAVALDLDYLRTHWMYAHSALGSMPYRYPSLPGTLQALALLPAGALLFKAVRTTRPLLQSFLREAKS